MTTTDPKQTQPAAAERPAPATAGAGVQAAEAAPGVSRWRDVAMGAAFQAEDVTAGLIAGLRRVVARRGQWVGEFAERGAQERVRGRRRLATMATAAIDAAATSVIVDRVVDAQLDRVLRPMVFAVLDDVLLLLEQEPERIQSLIRGQRESMVDEVIARIRTGAATGDTAVERLTGRMFQRGPRPPFPPPPAGDGT
jgi:hypothetical protein